MKITAVTILAFALIPITDSSAIPSLPDYRHFRALSIDLLGRPPTRNEVAELEQPSFNLERWVDTQLATPTYAERLRRVYMDLLRLELPQTVQFAASSVMLYRARITGPDNAPLDVYYRVGQRRKLAAIDGDLCFTGDEAEINARARGGATGSKPVTKALLEARTVLVKPWWLYGDYRDPEPKDRASPEWAQTHPGFELQLRQFVDADGSTPTTSVRVCREEAQVAETGRVYVSGRAPASKTDPIPQSRKRRAPNDSAFAKANQGKPISCLTQSGFQSSPDCGCGVGLERCLPIMPTGFVIANQAPLGIDEPFTTAPRQASAWIRQWWGEEAGKFLERTFAEDRDVRELLTSRGTVINGPLAQFYRGMAGTTCCGPGLELGYSNPEPLFDPAAVPRSLLPHDVTTWTPVVDRGKHAAGLMTMPVFLMKYGTRRARAHVLYQAFLCKDFQSPAAKLVPSTEVDLAKRQGCASCHRTLEPMAAFFTRVEESNWSYLPAAQFPSSSQRCANGDPKRMRAECKTYYDPDFTDAKSATLRGAHGSPTNAEAGPAGLGAQIVSSPEFASCVVQNVAQSFLGRSLETADQQWKAALTKTFVESGFRMRPLVKAVVTSTQYRERSDPKGNPP
ncbi:MAG TPA: DUF1585 domain-containing protein [Kofleriaceae bacterium]